MKSWDRMIFQRLFLHTVDTPRGRRVVKSYNLSTASHRHIDLVRLENLGLITIRSESYWEELFGAKGWKVECTDKGRELVDAMAKELQP